MKKSREIDCFYGVWIVKVKKGNEKKGGIGEKDGENDGDKQEPVKRQKVGNRN